MKSTYSPSKYAKVAKLLPAAARISEAPVGFYIDGFKDGVYLASATGAYVLLYTARNAGCSYGMTGFCLGGHVYNFDRHGIEDSWYPDGWDKPNPPEKIAELMREELDRAEKRLEAAKARETEGKVIAFGPTSRTLLPAEIDSYKAILAKGGSFSLTPSGFGTGYRFYLARGPRRTRWEAYPASAEAKKIFGAALVYDEFDYD